MLPHFVETERTMCGDVVTRSLSVTPAVLSIAWSAVSGGGIR